MAGNVLTVVDRGVIAKRGMIGRSGAVFGTDVILSNKYLRDMGDAVALTFVQTTSLTQGDIFELLPEYPNAMIIVRHAALRLAFTRSVVLASQVCNLPISRRLPPSRPPSITFHSRAPSCSPRSSCAA